MDIAATISTGDLDDGIMIGEGFLPTVLEMKFDSAVIPSPIFRFPRYATRNHTIRQKDQVLEFRVRHFLPLCLNYIEMD